MVFGAIECPPFRKMSERPLPLIVPGLPWLEGIPVLIKIKLQRCDKFGKIVYLNLHAGNHFSRVKSSHFQPEKSFRTLIQYFTSSTLGTTVVKARKAIFIAGYFRPEVAR